MSDDYSSALRLITPPASEPITLAQAKAFLRIEHTADDATITTAIATARQCAENHLRAALLPQTWDYSLGNPSQVTLSLPIGPVQSVTSITLTNELGNTAVMNTAHYRVSVDGYGILFTNLPQTEKLTVRVNVSLAATADALPAPIIQGMLHHIAVLIEQRDGVMALPMQSIACY